MNIKQLKEAIKDLPDGMWVVTGDGDHNYRKIESCLADACYCRKSNIISESSNDPEFDKELGKKMEVFVIL